MTQEKGIFQNVLTFLPLFSAVLILMGFCYLSAYYDQFGINILSYLEFSEIILSFLNQVVLIIIASVIAYIVSSTVNSLDKPLAANWLTEDTAKWQLLNKATSFKAAARLYYSLYKRTILSFARVTIVIIVLRVLVEGFTWNTVRETVMWGVSFLGAMIYIFESSRENGQLSSKAIVTKGIIVLGLFSLYGTYLVGQREAKKVMKQKGLYQTSLIFEDGKTFHSTETRYFVGQTNNYLFIYDNEKKSAEIIPIREIKRIVTELK
ncbi:MAG: hypothetical protein ACTHMM_21235 [Agriterribacter sp.]